MRKRNLVILGWGSPQEWGYALADYFSIHKVDVINGMSSPLKERNIKHLKSCYDTILCHSFGYSIFLQSRLSCSKLIVCAGFEHFSATPLQARLLQRMLKRFELNPYVVVKDFQERCLLNAKKRVAIPLFGMQHKQQIGMQLALLQKEVHCSPKLQQRVSQSATFHAFENDPIVPLALTKDAYEHASEHILCDWVSHTGHAHLPF